MGAERVFGELSTVQVTVLEACWLPAGGADCGCEVFAVSCAGTDGASATVIAAKETKRITKLRCLRKWRI